VDEKGWQDNRIRRAAPSVSLSPDRGAVAENSYELRLLPRKIVLKPNQIRLRTERNGEAQSFLINDEGYRSLLEMPRKMRFMG